MIYLNNREDAQCLFVPRVEEPKGNLKLLLKNSLNLVTTIDEVIDLNTSALFYNIAVELPESVTEGEFEYTLKDEEKVLSSGLLVIGCDALTPRQYEKSIQYEQYKTK